MKRTTFELLTSSTGFSLVALVCAYAGYVAVAGEGFKSADLVIIFLYVLTLLPYFFFREGVLEQRLDKDEKLSRTSEVQSTLLIGVLLLVIVGLAVGLILQPNTSTDLVLLLFSIGWLPFIYLAIRTYKAVSHVEQLEEEYLFQNRVLFPALATCLIPFSFGWALRGNVDDMIAVLLAGVLLAAFSESARRRKWRLHQVLIILLVSVLASAALVPIVRTLSVLVFGALMTLSMGVSEVCKRVRTAGIPNRPMPRGENVDYYLAGSNWSSIVFPLLLGFLPLLVKELPAWPVILLMSAQSFTWYALIKDKRGVGAFWFGTILGFGLPLVIIVSILYLPGSAFVRSSYVGFMMSLGVAILAVTFFLSRILTNRTVRSLILARAWQNVNYLNPRYCTWLFVMTGAFAMIGVGVLATVLDAILTEPQYLRKATEIQVGIFILLCLIGLYHWWKPHEKKIAAEKVPAQSSGSGGTMRQILTTARLPVSAIPALFVGSALWASGTQELLLIVLWALPMTAVTMGGFILNDVLDYEKDRKANVRRPIAQQLLSREIALTWSSFFLCCAILLSTLTGSLTAIVIVVSTAAGVCLYSLLASRFPLAKGAATVLLTLTPILYLVSITRIDTPVFVLVVFGTFIFGRELLLDELDLTGDARSGLHTLAYYIGRRSSRLAGWAIMLLSYAVLLVSQTRLQDIFLLGFALLSICAIFAFRHPDHRRSAIVATRIVLALGAFGVALNLS